jgi:hypothetical protein
LAPSFPDRERVVLKKKGPDKLRAFLCFQDSTGTCP